MDGLRLLASVLMNGVSGEGLYMMLSEAEDGIIIGTKEFIDDIMSEDMTSEFVLYGPDGEDDGESLN